MRHPRSMWPLTAALALCCGALAPQSHAAYCTTGAGRCSMASADERITRVVFNTIDNNSGFADQPAGCRSDFTAISTSVTQGQTYTLTVEYINAFSADGGIAWIDWNGDMTFGNDASGERIQLSGGAGVYGASITVPATAVPGASRLRVMVNFNQGTIASCVAANFGEVEDYGLVIVAGTTGACCTPGSGVCTVSTPGDCTAAGGTPQAVGTSCTVSNLCGGSCCVGGACTTTTAAACSGAYVPGGLCGADACQYCAAGSGRCDSGITRISQVTFGSISNFSGTGVGPPGCYTDFTTQSNSVFRGATVPITVTAPSVLGQDQGAVWIDWNQDFLFGDVASGERVNLTRNGGTYTGNVTVPTSALFGSTRLRIRLMSTGTLTPCGTMLPSPTNFGEVEDYTVMVFSAVAGACCQGGGVCAITEPTPAPGRSSAPGRPAPP